MNDFLALSPAQRKRVFESVAHSVPLPANALEKDFWVSALLQVLFALPMAKNFVFKGGTSLSKGWHLIERFSEDIDIAVDRTLLGVTEGDLTKKQIKKLRKASSLFVSERLAPLIDEALQGRELRSFISMEIQPNGEGDGTYPEPRQIRFHYRSVFDKGIAYLRPDVILEVGARSLLEPSEPRIIRSIVEETIPLSPIGNSHVRTAIPAKTFLEKIFLLHELFSQPYVRRSAERKSRHIYDLFMMRNQDFAKSAIGNDELWETIRHHRETYTSVTGVDYTPDVRKRIQLVPSEEIIDVWSADYEAMKEAMIYGSKPTFEELMKAMKELQEVVRATK